MHRAQGSAAATHRRRLVAVLLLSLAMLAVEVVGGVAANSLALLADAGHMLTDVAGVGMALLAIWFAGRTPTNGRTYGYLRLEILAAVTNAFLLFGVAAFILFEAWRRLSEPPEIASGLMLAVALVGLAANAARSSCCATPSARASTCEGPISRSWATSRDPLPSSGPRSSSR